MNRFITALGVSQICAWGTLYYSFPQIAEAMGAELGWTKAERYLAPTLTLLIAAVSAIPVGIAIDRGHGRAVMTFGAIAEALDMEPSSLTRSLSPLLRRGLVELASGPDRRERRARVTHEGKRVLEQAHERWQHIQARLAEDIGEEDFQKLLALLQQGRQRIANRSAAHQEESRP
ncbi:MarR family winged helix-turn-helix transcriptional regulator [Sediminicurvatus halobius]|uniref:HTH marR-type domain-containing protein n=1 Tax=Sediminicurvatus halobius TaxID=2182432 RepID=A0A2U2MWI0_9GAMM|nr:MarR family winged helix-turn-helix transcriptional regulator [Spiribacter halobius]PWG61213.1 hypothetical protein DEM34_17690 [Spiribacter halobius]UEX77952.1 hypothetical protein LMH63_18815 [Spiribacter halobius]